MRRLFGALAIILALAGAAHAQLATGNVGVSGGGGHTLITIGPFAPSTSNAGTIYASLPGAVASSATEAIVQMPQALTGTYKGLQCTSVLVAGASNSYTITMHESAAQGTGGANVGTPGSITCTISGASSLACSDTTNSYTVPSVGVVMDMLATTTVGGGAPSATQLKCTIEFDAN